MADLTNKEHLFVTEYLKHGVGSKAVIAAGYSQSGASVTANRLLKRASVAAAIARHRRPIEKKSELTAGKILEALNGLVDMDPAMLFDENNKLRPINEIPLEARKALTGIDMDKGSVKFASRLGAIELSAKLLGMIREQQTQQTSVQIIVAAHPEIPVVTLDGAKLTPEW
jgi:hypothetical protein